MLPTFSVRIHSTWQSFMFLLAFLPYKNHFHCWLLCLAFIIKSLQKLSGWFLDQTWAFYGLETTSSSSDVPQATQISFLHESLLQSAVCNPIFVGHYFQLPWIYSLHADKIFRRITQLTQMLKVPERAGSNNTAISWYKSGPLQSLPAEVAGKIPVWLKSGLTFLT